MSEPVVEWTSHVVPSVTAQATEHQALGYARESRIRADDSHNRWDPEEVVHTYCSCRGYDVRVGAWAEEQPKIEEVAVQRAVLYSLALAQATRLFDDHVKRAQPAAESPRKWWQRVSVPVLMAGTWLFGLVVIWVIQNLPIVR